jgi:hypothetical protein
MNEKSNICIFFMAPALRMGSLGRQGPETRGSHIARPNKERIGFVPDHAGRPAIARSMRLGEHADRVTPRL